MPGKTGKRAKSAAPCKECGKKIVGDFHRNSDGDRHPECWHRWWDFKNGQGKMELDLKGLVAKSLSYIEIRRIEDGMNAVALTEPKAKAEAQRQIEQLLDGARALQSLDDLGLEANKRIDKAMRWLIAKADRLKAKSF
jgi:hypothetical protein